MASNLNESRLFPSVEVRQEPKEPPDPDGNEGFVADKREAMSYSIMLDQ